VRSALLVIDMLNPYEHEDAEPLKQSVRECLPALQALIERTRDSELLTVYVNDNHGDWSAARQELSERALDGAAPELVEPILPAPDLPSPYPWSPTRWHTSIPSSRRRRCA
jgi:nicotinamidase-related amidase